MIPPYLTVTYFSFATGENTLREFPLVIATVAKVSRKRGLWLVVFYISLQIQIDELEVIIILCLLIRS